MTSKENDGSKNRAKPESIRESKEGTNINKPPTYPKPAAPPPPPSKRA